METEVERLGRADALTTFIHDFFQRTKNLFSEKDGVWFSFDTSPNASDVGGMSRKFVAFLNKFLISRKRYLF